MFRRIAGSFGSTSFWPEMARGLPSRGAPAARSAGQMKPRRSAEMCSCATRGGRSLPASVVEGGRDFRARAPIGESSPNWTREIRPARDRSAGVLARGEGWLAVGQTPRASPVHPLRESENREPCSTRVVSPPSRKFRASAKGSLRSGVVHRLDRGYIRGTCWSRPRRRAWQRLRAGLSRTSRIHKTLSARSWQEIYLEREVETAGRARGGPAQARRGCGSSTRPVGIGQTAPGSGTAVQRILPLEQFVREASVGRGSTADRIPCIRSGRRWRTVGPSGARGPRSMAGAREFHPWPSRGTSSMRRRFVSKTIDVTSSASGRFRDRCLRACATPLPAAEAS